MNAALIQPFSSEEVKCAPFQMYPFTSPGPDGLSPVFYQTYWHIVGPKSHGELRGVAINRQGPRVSHLLFADDTLIFCRASGEAMYYVKRVLKEFEAASRMVVNLEKLEIAFSRNISERQKEDLARILKVRVVEKHAIYLGLPALVGRSKKEIFQSLKDRIWK
ncbi:UNVERIFIED_CONTAM: hypothetical protein Sradi_5843000 [Sesamum radiatum]|uniref:Reverse transcriptase domain-containing protein n=1 Tax=Sesamum radiatum TaxID=300843 RepID=A0AAW2KT24_SESRA